jgi:Protein of unknown function (DUF4199)
MPAKKISIPLLFALIAAVTMILVVIGTWMAGPAAFIGWPVWLGRSLVILMAAIATSAERRAHGGILDFRSAFRVAFGVLALAIVTQSFFVWLIPNFLDPHFNQRLTPVILASAEKSYRQFGATDDQLRQALDDIRTHNQFSLGRVIEGTGFQLILFGIIGLLIAVTVRSRKGPTPRPGL